VADLIEDLRFGVAIDANMELQNEQDVVNGDNFNKQRIKCKTYLNFNKGL
jgi:hypothetical protein